VSKPPCGITGTPGSWLRLGPFGRSGNAFDHVARDGLARTCGQGNGESIPIGPTDGEGITARYADETFQRSFAGLSTSRARIG
jgi:hypothetical protein